MFSLLVRSKKLQYTCMGPLPLYKTLLNGCGSGGVWTEVGIQTHPFPLWQRHCERFAADPDITLYAEMYDLAKSVWNRNISKPH